MNRKRICLVTSEIVGPFRNGGIGTHCFYLAQFLSKRSDWETTIVYNGAIDKHDVHHWVRFFRDICGAKFVWVRPSDKLSYTHWHAPTCLWDQISQLNYGFLKKNPQDLVIFQEMLGGGFRSIQAKRSIGCFANTPLVVMVHSSWEWVNQSMGCLPAYGLPEMMTKFMERYSVEHCDELVSPSQYMLDWSQSDVPRLPERCGVLPYLFEEGIRQVSSAERATEVIFFGRLEQRKGLVLLLEALTLMAKNDRLPSGSMIPVYFLGKAGQTVDGDGLATISRFRSGLAATFDLRVIDDLGHLEALDFLRSHPSALVVCPSLQDNSPYAIIENLELGTNIIACATGGIPELFEDRSRLCAPQPEPLAELIRQGMAGTLPPVKAAYSREKARTAWGDFLEAKLRHAPDHTSCREKGEPSFLVMGWGIDEVAIDLGKQYKGQIAIRNGRFFLRSAASLPNFQHEVPLVSTPHDDRLGSATSGFGLASHCLLLSRGTILTAGAADVLKLSVQRDPGCIWTGFVEVGAGTPRAYTPLGECCEAALYGNVFGSCVAVFPWVALRQLNSEELCLLEYSLEWNAQWWPLLASLAFRGWKLRVVPEVLARQSQDFLVSEAVPQSLSLRLAVLRAASKHLPTWAGRMLPYFAAAVTMNSPGEHPSTDAGDTDTALPHSSPAFSLQKLLNLITNVTRRS